MRVKCVASVEVAHRSPDTPAGACCGVAHSAPSISDAHPPGQLSRWIVLAADGKGAWKRGARVRRREGGRERGRERDRERERESE